MHNVISIDLGGTKIEAGVINAQGKILKSITTQTDAEKGKEAVIDKLIHLIEYLKVGLEVKAIGIGSPGFVDVEKGMVLFAETNLPGWTKVTLQQIIENASGIPTIVDNDANVAALCEGWIGVAKEYDDFLMITLGTGVGGAFYSRKRSVWRGHHWQGGEFGHMILYPEGRLCGCGQKGCAEKYISGRAIEQIYQEKTGEKLNTENIFQKYHRGDLASSEIIDDFVKNLAIFMISLKNIFDPQAFVIGGGLIYAKDVWWSSLDQYFHKKCNNSENTMIVPAKYLNKAGVIGAAKLAFDRIVNL
ncbi:ROK family protein [Clostridiaceae bacterium 35-E11]